MSQFELAVIEGFYGRCWSDSARLAMLPFLAEQRYNSYIYAPKQDRSLRAQWQQPWDRAQLQSLQQLAGACRQQGLGFAIGLSPMGLESGFSAPMRAHLRNKLEQIATLGLDRLCILFDDMPGADGALLSRQLDLMELVVLHSGVDRLAMCPTYYSSDPRLDQVFGQRPVNYLADLGRLLPPAIDLFWTGEQVICDQISVASVAAIAELLRRPPLLWDNYPVNDGRATADFLHLYPYTGRSWQLREVCRGHVVNPMNQAYLSCLPLASLPVLYRQAASYQPDKQWLQGLQQLCSAPLQQLLQRDQALFQQRGRASLSEVQNRQLQDEYQALATHQPMAAEVVAWLAGEYQFDPACLTD